MGLISGLFRSRDKPKNSTAGSGYSFFFGGSSAGKSVNERSALQMTAVYSCVRILAEAVAGLPFHLYRYTQDGGKEKAIDHSLYIRLISSGIVIGESSSNIKLKLENDILYFFTGEEDTVSTENALAYFSAGKLYVNNVEILTSMRIGPFAWVPESDNLNFKLMEA